MPRPADLGAGILESINTAYRATGQQAIRLSTHDGDWFGRVSALPPPFATGTLVAIAVPSGEFIGSLIAAAKDGVLFSALVVLLFLPLVYLAANAVAAPLLRLTGEIDKLQRLETDESRPVATFIREIQNLADALARSKFMLRVFGKYVPRNLVQQFVDTGTEPRLGGERRRLAVYFSDVRDFTTISEELPPEELMLVTSEYLEGLVEIILQSRGTVDKFVGDQIMAYWNAPTLNPNHATDGCIAVLRSRDWSNRQNEIWEKAGRRVLYTRFAVHLGEAVVGNVGSSDRMDYTVVGNTINLGSRLEGLNKIYGTQVLISEPVASEVPGKFVMRPVDKVLPKGAVYPITVYELLGANPNWLEAPKDILATEAQRAMCERWSTLYLTYLKRDWTALDGEIELFLRDYPEDPLALLYRSRLVHFAVDPPADVWDGVIRYSEK
jgi:adenylate cyclase